MIFYVDGSPSITSSNAFEGPVVHSSNGNYQVDNIELVELDDPTKKCFTNKWFVINGNAYQVRVSGPAYNFAHAEQGNISLVDEAGHTLDVPSEIAYLIRNALPRMRLDNLAICDILDYKDLDGFSLFLANIDTNEFIYREGLRLQNAILLSDGVYGYHKRSKGLKKLDHELNDAWAFDPGAPRFAPMQAIPHKDTILYYHGFARSEVLEDVPIPGAENLVYRHAVRRDGELYCLDRKTGEKRWERMFPYGLNDMVLHDGKLYCVAENELFRLSPETGEIEHQVQMEYSAGGDTELSNVLTVIDNKLWIQINHWFYKTHCLLVVDLESFAIDHKIDIPAPYQPEKFLYYDERKRQVYYRLHFRHAEIRVEHNHPLLVLNLDELDQPLTFEPRPEIDISFKPEDDNKDLEELWVHIKDTSLHKALRFGIIETQNQTNVHAEMNRHGEDCRKTFNGRVHFRYSGSDKSKEEVEEQLKVIKNSFNDWAKIMNVEAGSGEPVSIDVAFEE
ncbi:MAG: PQQ-binding-like beta-propeller repeat protein [Gammaproteobacteria bacterium]|nr:PQQ-binding-like beta-propeller repeat protein [Gammaproteobacteria bacterium]